MDLLNKSWTLTFYINLVFGCGFKHLTRQFKIIVEDLHTFSYLKEKNTTCKCGFSFWLISTKPAYNSQGNYPGTSAHKIRSVIFRTSNNNNNIVRRVLQQTGAPSPGLEDYSTEILNYEYYMGPFRDTRFGWLLYFKAGTFHRDLISDKSDKHLKNVFSPMKFIVCLLHVVM